jgi:threonine aldolase
MRQVGVIAAAGLISLEKMTLRLGEDHQRAKQLADGLRSIGGIVLDEETPQTNMVYFNLADQVGVNSQQVTARMKDLGILVSAEGPRRFRLVTHYWIDDDAVGKSISAFGKALQ